MHADIEPDEIQKFESSLFGAEYQIARQSVCFRKTVASFRRRVHDRGKCHGADPVGNKAGLVFAADRRLAETVVYESVHGRKDLFICIRVGYELDKIHIANRIEEVDAKESAPSVLIHAFCYRRNGYVRRVRADYGIG